MRKIVISLIAVVLLAASANMVAAADWKGFYVGGAVGYVDHTSSWTDIDYWWYGGTLDLSKNGMLFGAVAGYNWQPDTVVYGIELNLNGASAESETCYDNCDDVQIENELTALHSLKGRVGVPAGNSLLYATLGIATGTADHEWTEVGGSSGDNFEIENSNIGHTFGVGVEHQFSDLISLKIEYSKTSLSWESDENGSDYVMKVADDVEAVMVGLNFGL